MPSRTGGSVHTVDISEFVASFQALGVKLKRNSPSPENAVRRTTCQFTSTESKGRTTSCPYPDPSCVLSLLRCVPLSLSPGILRVLHPILVPYPRLRRFPLLDSTHHRGILKNIVFIEPPVPKTVLAGIDKFRSREDKQGKSRKVRDGRSDDVRHADNK